MGCTAGNLGQLVGTAEFGVELVALGLGAMVLPVGGIRVREGTLELVGQRRIRAQPGEQVLGVAAPVYAAVLLAGAADAADAREGSALLPQAVEDEVNGLEPHGDRGEDLAFVLVYEHALFDVILFGEVIVEIYFSFGGDPKIRLDDDS